MTGSKAEEFAALHVPGKPLVLFNIWDPGSVVAVAGSGASALATGSWGVAGAFGYKDGETLPLDLVCDNAMRILRVVDLPLTVDLEAGYGQDAAAVGESVARVAALGIAGINLEDKDPATRILFDTATQCQRIAAAARSDIFINARCDLFITTAPDDHDEALVDAAIERAHAYADAGAGGLFLPFLQKPALIERACAASPLPVNILMRAGCPDHAALAGLGVGRISHGHGPWADAMDWLAGEARKIYEV
ncbi:MAG: isocitrate lyase/phosphoenolpyruvate mutase family protein [Blastomonas sp.]